jgi:30S ribosomal protein S31
MGKGDRRSRRGKIWAGTYGARRPGKKKAKKKGAKR